MCGWGKCLKTSKLNEPSPRSDSPPPAPFFPTNNIRPLNFPRGFKVLSSFLYFQNRMCHIENENSICYLMPFQPASIVAQRGNPSRYTWALIQQLRRRTKMEAYPPGLSAMSRILPCSVDIWGRAIERCRCRWIGKLLVQDSVYQLFLLSGRFLSDVLFKSFAPNTKSLRTAKVNWSQKDPGICTLQSNSLGKSTPCHRRLFPSKDFCVFEVSFSNHSIQSTNAGVGQDEYDVYEMWAEAGTSFFFLFLFFFFFFCSFITFPCARYINQKDIHICDAQPVLFRRWSSSRALISTISPCGLPT